MASSSEVDQPIYYQIRVGGTLDQGWAEWFAPLKVIAQANGETLLVGPIPDQAALHGLLVKIRNLGLPLISVQSEAEEGT